MLAVRTEEEDSDASLALDLDSAYLVLGGRYWLTLMARRDAPQLRKSQLTPNARP